LLPFFTGNFLLKRVKENKLKREISVNSKKISYCKVLYNFYMDIPLPTLLENFTENKKGEKKWQG
jgi:hypothetical protein